MRILISGRSGLVGSELSAAFQSQGDQVAALVRNSNRDGVLWDPASGRVDAQAMEGFDGVVHLAGENVADGRWTQAKRARIRDSRVKGTRLLSETLAGLQSKPSFLISASAIGFYGSRGEEACDESAGAGNGFLADVAQEWESATAAAAEAGIRVVHVRIGVVLSRQGGALAKMLPLFRWGLGGRLGSGRQYFSWISLRDLVNVFVFAANNPNVSGPINAVSPQPVTNREFTRVLGQVVHRPTLFPVPAFALRLLLGTMADEMLLGGARVVPQRLKQLGFAYQDAVLEETLKHEIGQ